MVTTAASSCKLKLVDEVERRNRKDARWAMLEKGMQKEHCLFIDDLKLYKKNLKNLGILNEAIVKANIDTGAVLSSKEICCGGMKGW